MAYFRTEGVALVTGAAGGIGQGAGNAFAGAGASAVIFADINYDKAKIAAEESKRLSWNTNYEALALQIDVTNSSAVDHMVEEVSKRFGRIDYLVNSAGVDTKSYDLIPDNDMDDYDRVMNINAKGTLLVARAAIKVMEEQEPRIFDIPAGGTRDIGRGAIVNVTSAMSYAVIQGKVAYATSKHAALGITKALAVDVTSKGIRVNCICPGWVRTPMFEGECEKVPATLDLVRAVTSYGRPAEVDEVGNSIVYLCSPAASYVSGVGLLVDAGLTLTLHLG